MLYIPTRNLEKDSNGELFMYSKCQTERAIKSKKTRPRCYFVYTFYTIYDNTGSRERSNVKGDIFTSLFFLRRCSHAATRALPKTLEESRPTV